ncbi:MAG: AraC family transcriptional regulator [Marinifilaceae bacterium]|jgi:AraC-like DNA-binding protein|nr:AraC family transcriptional regulator [Marinifilaceae bacterium]
MRNNPDITTYSFNNKHTSLGVEISDLSKIMSIAKETGFSAHRLEFYQILVITRGRGIHEVDFQEIAYSENTVIPVVAGQVQKFHYNSNLEGYAILFQPDFIIKEPSDYLFLYDFTIFLHSLSPISSLANEAIYSLIREMKEEQAKQQAFFSTEFQRNLLKNFLIQIERNKRTRTNFPCNDSLDMFLKFRKLLEEHLSYKTKVIDLCQLMNITPKQLNASLKLYNNKTAKEFVDDRVMLEIKRLLVYSNLSVKEIAYEMGFEDPTNFTKYFKAKVKQLPTEYRKQEQK